jgi:DNA replication protein DnaC
VDAMTEIGEILKRIGITMTPLKTPVYGAITDQLLILLRGRNYAPEVLGLFNIEIDAALKTDRICPYCTGLDSCQMPSLGLQCYFDESAANMYGIPAWRWGYCDHLRRQNCEGAAKGEIAPRFQDMSFMSFRVTDTNREAYEKIKDYADYIKPETSYGLLLIGPRGTGKTHLATAVLRVAQLRGMSICSIAVPDLLKELRPGGNGDLEVRVRDRDIVLLDDMGTERVTGWVTEQLYRLINHRWTQELPTLITSNYTVEQLAERMGENGPKIMDRITGMCEIVPFKGQSWRRRR